MPKLRLAAAALLVATLSACAGIDVPTLSPPPTTPAATTPAATTPAATTPAATTPAATTPAATTPPASSPTATATLTAAEAWEALYAWSCTRVRHTSYGEFVSYLEWGIGLSEFLGQEPRDFVDYIEITVIGANDDEPEVLEYDAELGSWLGFFGLRNAGAKTIVNVRVHWQDGSVNDATEKFIEDLGTDTFDVRFPQEDDFGDCDEMGEVGPPA